MDLVDETLRRIGEWATGHDDIQAVILLGSQARTDHAADEWSDIDLAVLVDDPDRYLGSPEWLDDLGPVLVTVVEPSALGGGMERRVLFRSGIDVDFSFVAAAAAVYLADLADDPTVRELLGRGVRILVDKMDPAGMLPAVSVERPTMELPTQADIAALSDSFWYHAMVAAKKLRRGEVWVAKTSCDGHLNKLLVELLTWRTRALDPEVDTWHAGRFLEEWADPQSLVELREASSVYDPIDVARALRSTAAMFERLELDVARMMNGDVAASHDEVHRRLREILTAG